MSCPADYDYHEASSRYDDDDYRSAEELANDLLEEVHNQEEEDDGDEFDETVFETSLDDFDDESRIYLIFIFCSAIILSISSLDAA